MNDETTFALQDVYDILEEIREDYARRQDQAILQQDLYKANYALAGKETCNELRRRIDSRLQMQVNMARVLAGGKRAAVEKIRVK